jgi:hypothetical protein
MWTNMGLSPWGLRYIFTLWGLGLKDDFLQICFSEKTFLAKNVWSGVSKKIIFLEGNFKPP